MSIQYRYIQIHYDNLDGKVVAIADGDAFRDQLTLPMYAVLNQYGSDGWRLVGQSVTPSQCDPHDPNLLFFHLTFIREVD
tara:strand:+ start:111 stop:350 length:240 start_codon:yes stop_codon:yes gene_type:complete